MIAALTPARVSFVPIDSTIFLFFCLKTATLVYFRTIFPIVALFCHSLTLASVRIFDLDLRRSHGGMGTSACRL